MGTTCGDGVVAARGWRRAPIQIWIGGANEWEGSGGHGARVRCPSGYREWGCGAVGPARSGGGGQLGHLAQRGGGGGLFFFFNLFSFLFFL